jgi:hypothetical protein
VSCIHAVRVVSLLLARHKICQSVQLSYSNSFPLLPTHTRCRGCLFSLDHTQTHTTVSRTPLDEGSARRRDLYLTIYNTHKRQTFMPPVGFEPAIPASARPQTNDLDPTATGIVLMNTLSPPSHFVLHANLIHSPRRWRQHVPPQHRNKLIILHAVVTQNAIT